VCATLAAICWINCTVTNPGERLELPAQVGSGLCTTESYWVSAADDYQLIDFGRGRKLERFGSYLIDRPCPAAENVRSMNPDRWASATARYKRRGGSDGVWTPGDGLPDQWVIRYPRFQLLLRPTPFGHLGVFPEQAENWNWLYDQISNSRFAWKVLNLFAYTGGSTLAAAAAGAQVVHVDAAENVVSWARRNAEYSGLQDAPIRWIGEDATKFVRREVRRGSHYDAIILDPPSYGHGPKGQVWKIEQHLQPLLAACGDLLAGQAGLVMLTCHSVGFNQRRLRRLLKDTCVPGSKQTIQSGALTLAAEDGRQLSSGSFARWSSEDE
jgi:23S rRNA (cytosine1962-C5)-methyltransferase